MLEEKSFGEVKLIGAVQIVQILPHKVKDRLTNGQTRWIKQLSSQYKFSNQGEGYFQKNVPKTLPNPDPAGASMSTPRST